MFKFSAWLLILFVFVLFKPDNFGQRKSRMITFEPNVYAPELYSDNLKMQVALVGLPGAESKGSYWQAEYKVYFLPEGEIKKVMEQRRGRDPQPEDFPNKILLDQGSFKKTVLRTIKDRTAIRPPFAFKAKVSDRQRTKFANLLTAYSIKIYDAKLNQTFYKTDIFIGHPFDDDEKFSGGAFTPRKTVYLSLFVDTDGSIYTSQMKRAAVNTSW